MATWTSRTGPDTSEILDYLMMLQCVQIAQYGSLGGGYSSTALFIQTHSLPVLSFSLEEAAPDGDIERCMFG